MDKQETSKYKLKTANIQYVKENIRFWADSVGLAVSDGVLNLASVEIGVNLYNYVSNEGYVDYTKVKNTITNIDVKRQLSDVAVAYLVQAIYLQTN